MIQRTNIGLGIAASKVALIALLLAITTILYDAHAPWEGAKGKQENTSESTADSEDKKTVSPTDILLTKASTPPEQPVEKDSVILTGIENIFSNLRNRVDSLLHNVNGLLGID